MDTAQNTLDPAACRALAISHPRNLLRLAVQRSQDRMAIAGGRSALIIVIGIGAFVGASASQVLYHRGISFPSVVSWEF